jgi:hypothetical protein
MIALMSLTFSELKKSAKLHLIPNICHLRSIGKKDDRQFAKSAQAQKSGGWKKQLETKRYKMCKQFFDIHTVVALIYDVIIVVILYNIDLNKIKNWLLFFMCTSTKNIVES